MKSYEQYKRLMRFAFGFFLISNQMGIFWFVWMNYYSSFMETPYYGKGHWLLVSLYGTLIFIFARLYGGWKVGFLRPFKLIYSQCLSAIFSNIVMYLVITLLTKHFQVIYPLAMMSFCQFIVIEIWGIVSSRIYLYVYPPRKVLLIYGDKPIKGLIGKLHSRMDRFEIREAVDIKLGLNVIKNKILGFEGVVICDIPSPIRNQILKYCYGNSIRAYTSPKISDIIIRSAEGQHMFDTPLLLSRNTGLTAEQRFLKRMIDIILSFISLIVTSPLMIAVAICIKLQDGGPALYKQIRLTQDGKLFKVYKFRSMRMDAERDGVARLASENDDRITSVGRIIRSVRLDELPQLINILKGDMSIVGPRPERPEIASGYETSIPEFTYRLKVKAGLTGYAQVYGKYNTTAYDKLKLDLMYIQNYSIWLDFEIMFKTVQILFMKESTEGLKEGQLTAVSEESRMR